ncbi:MAG: hypothetical protein WCH85_11420 [Methanomicrobiales archaeon]
MKQIGGLMRRAFAVSILMVLIGLVMVGTVAAIDNDMMDNCQRLAAGNGTYGYGPGMMGGSGMMGAGGVQMMQSVEVSAMGQPMHDEMQGLVTKMMAGSISSTDQARMVEIMNKYPGASNMMVTRMTGGNGQNLGGYPGMMGTNGQNYYGMMGTGGVYSGAGMMGGAGMMDAGLMTGGSILIVLFFIIWMVVGILAIIWFVKQLQKDKV